ncbi:MAG: ABC transporter permease [Rhodospirillum sp.]|nr:ABC transporter permease [Rhodospirillum sp.]MCF8487823.1 ABC transporter permease [Rhodospirillum sp.]
MKGKIVTGLLVMAALVALWQGAYHLAGERAYILPSPWLTLTALVERWDLIARHAWVTMVEILLGLGLGALLGGIAALVIALSPAARRTLLPLLVISQAVPVFAIAPLLVLWLGYGMSSKVAMAVLIIFFPVTAAFLDGLRRADSAWIDMAQSMDASPWAVLWRIRLPAALPALASGLRVATAVAPIGAIVGEWVGSSAGLGYLMLHANARMQVSLMFAALFVLALFSVSLYALVDRGLRAAMPWQRES